MSSVMNYGTTKTFHIPIDHLDYKFIETCTDVQHLEKILSILRSGEEGSYPDLTGFCEKRIESLAPNSRALRQDKPAATPASFTSEEWREIEDDVESWVTEIKVKENKISFQKTENVFQEKAENVPPVRSSTSVASAIKNKTSENTLGNKKRTPREYKDWEKFDVEKECSKIDETLEEKSAKTIINSKMLKIEKRIDTSGASEIEIGYIAIHEREKGNEAFRTGDYEEAVTYYTRSISVRPTLAAYNNRAQAEIKRQKWQNALNDCEKVLELEPGNSKALLRRATVNKHLNNHQRAVEDLNRVLCDEPGNATAKKLLSEIKENLKGDGIATHGKGKRIIIQEVEDTDEGDEVRKRDQADKRAGVSEGGETAHETSDMGNAQKKFPGREECSKPEEPQPRRPREDGECGARREPPARGPASDNKGGEARRQQPPQREAERAGAGPDTLLPPTAAGLKSRGNELFKSGQFGAAIGQYTEAIESLQSAGVHVPEDLSVLYSNRAACYLKDGNCGDCIEDCHRSLELQPFSVKPLLRRAMAYESVERYRQAYVDYKTVLQIDSGIQSANDSINRITRTLMDQDGLTWREKLPPIPAVPVSAQSHRWGGTSNISSEDKQPTQISSKKAEAMFLSFKQEGNAFVKKAQYKQALEKYSACVKLNSEECSIYTNRALCYLKLGQFEEARQDCNSALQLDDSNVKAFYRRALANKGLQNYQASVDDLNKVLHMDANVTEARNELEEVTQFLKSTTNGTVTNHEKQRKKIQIQEINEEVKISSKDLQHSVTTGDNNKSPAATSTKLTISKPSNAYDFGQLMNAIRAEKDRAACADLLTTVDPKDLPAFLSNKLEGDTFLIIIQSLKRYLLEKEPELVYQHLFYLSKAERFQMMLLLLSKNEKVEVQALFNALSERQCEQIILEDVQSLSRSYGL